MFFINSLIYPEVPSGHNYSQSIWQYKTLIWFSDTDLIILPTIKYYMDKKITHFSARPVFLVTDKLETAIFLSWMHNTLNCKAGLLKELQAQDLKHCQS